MCVSQDTGGILTHNCSDFGFNSYRAHTRPHHRMSVGVELRPQIASRVLKWGRQPCRHHSFPPITVSSSEIICNANFLTEVQKISSEKPHHWRTALKFLTGSLAGWRPSVWPAWGKLSVSNKMTFWAQSVLLKHLQRLMKFTETTNILKYEDNLTQFNISESTWVEKWHIITLIIIITQLFGLTVWMCIFHFFKWDSTYIVDFVVVFPFASTVKLFSTFSWPYCCLLHQVHLDYSSLCGFIAATYVRFNNTVRCSA